MYAIVLHFIYGVSRGCELRNYATAAVISETVKKKVYTVACDIFGKLKRPPSYLPATAAEGGDYCRDSSHGVRCYHGNQTIIDYIIIITQYVFLLFYENHYENDDSKTRHYRRWRRRIGDIYNDDNNVLPCNINYRGDVITANNIIFMNISPAE